MTKIIRFAQLFDAAGNVTGESTLDPSIQNGVVSIGNFDGVHLGHAALLSEVRQRATQVDGPSVAVIFDPHPAAILRPDRIPPRLTWIERRAELLNQTGIDYLLVIETSREFLSLSAEAFFQSLIVDQLKAKSIVEGPNFFFGRGRSGNVDTLRRLCQEHDINFSIVEPTEVDEEMISSTRIRDLLARGQIEAATKLLGTPHRIRGHVTTGAKRGREIGFPTANLSQLDVVAPGPGVYGGFAWIDSTRYDAAIHIGPNPTFDDTVSHKIEVHVLDYTGDLYGELLMVDFITTVREIVRFESAEQLAQQLTRDIKTIRTRLDIFRESTANHDASYKGK